MNKTISFIRLDYITVKPYFTLKNLIIFSAVALIMIISSGTATTAIAILMVYATLYVSYPFAIGEQNGIDALYATLAIKRNTVVSGRYLFALIIDICAGLLAYLFSFAVLSIIQKEFNALESLIVMLVMFIFYSIIQAIQLPIYFKLGYAKAKFLAYIPFVGMALIMLPIIKLANNNAAKTKMINFFGWVAANPYLTLLIGLLVWVVIIFISYKISLSYYKKRDF